MASWKRSRAECSNCAVRKCQPRRKPGMRILFDAGRTATKQDLLDAAALLDNYRKHREGRE